MICTHYGNHDISARTLGALVYRIINDYPYTDYVRIENYIGDTDDFIFGQGGLETILTLPSYKRLYVNDDVYLICQGNLDEYGKYIEGWEEDNETSE